ncbi:MAG: arginyltransferase [Planctomycetota bacterium]
MANAGQPTHTTSSHHGGARSESDPVADESANAAEFPCPYLPDRTSRSEVYSADGLTPELYEALMAFGFRRSGQIVYRPVCEGCRECRQLRVPVCSFVPTKSMRRAWRRNADTRVEIRPPLATEEKFQLFRRYLDYQHDSTMARTYESFRDFLYYAPMESMEFSYFLRNRLAAVSIADVCPNGLSSVYVFFDPELGKRSLGIYSALWEIDYCKKNNLDYYYLGFYVAQSKTMSYKARFRPNEVVADEGRWITLTE